MPPSHHESDTISQPRTSTAAPHREPPQKQFPIRHYDLPSLLAGKLHVAITRKYAKGRDWYDLVWYLSQRPPVAPNVSLLQNALDQTQGAGRYDAQRWRDLVRERLATLNLQAVSDEVSPFLERPQDAALLTRENQKRLLGSSDR